MGILIQTGNGCFHQNNTADQCLFERVKEFRIFKNKAFL